MKIHLLICYCICLFPGFGFSQQLTFSKIYCPQNIAAIGRNILITDSGYIAAGVDVDSISHIQTLVLIKLDSLGNETKTTTPFINSVKYYPGTSGSLFLSTDSCYFWCGGIRSNVKDYGFLLKLDSNLNSLWIQEFTANNDSSYSFLTLLQAKQTYDEGFILVGEIDGLSAYNTNILLIKTDSTGSKIWQKTFSFLGMGCGWNVIQTPDHGFLIGAGGYTAGVNHSYKGVIIKTDSLGNQQWRRIIGSDDYDNRYCVVANSPDGNFIVGTMTGVGFLTIDESYRKIHLIKYDPSGGKIWDKYYGDSLLSSALNQIIIEPDSEIVAIGFNYPNHPDTGDTWGWIQKVNYNGDVLWRREHYLYKGYVIKSRLYDIKSTPDGGYVLCGEADSFPAVAKSIWVLKVDSLGCLVPGCQNVGMKELVITNEELVMYPNPASDAVTLQFPDFLAGEVMEICIFTNTGQEVLHQTAITGSKDQAVDLRTLPPGAYYVRAITKEMSVSATKKLIISR